MRNRAFFLFSFFMVLLSGPAIAADAATDPNTQSAREFVDSLGKRVLETVNSGDQSKLQQMFIENVDIAWMGQFALGHNWRQASAEQKEKYLQAYRDYLLARYTTNFADYAGSKYTITNVKQDSGGQYLVNMQIDAPKQPEEMIAGYRLRKNDKGEFKITDIIVEGVSLMTTQRAEFGSVVQQQGMGGLVTSLQSKTTTEAKNKAT